MNQWGRRMSPDGDEIKDSLNACRTVQEVNDCARHYGPAVRGFQKSKDPDIQIMAIQIINLAAYQRMAITGRFKT